MKNDPLLAFRLIFLVCFIGTLFAGVWLAKNHHRLFGKDPSVPSETESERFYTKTEVFLVWILAVKLFGMAVIFL